jgi:hypothetical protein
MGVLTATEILGLYVLYAVHFLPIAVVFLMAWIRYSIYREQTRHSVRHRDSVVAPDHGLAYFAMRSRPAYDAHRRDNAAVLPFAVYLGWLVVNAGMEAAGMFLVWYNEAGYTTWVYQTSMGLQFIIVLAKLFWLLAFFDVTSYHAAATAAGALLVLAVTNAIIIVQDAPGRAYNWVLDMLVAIFYLYTFLLMVHFYHVAGRRRHYHASGWADQVDVFGMLFGTREGARAHGVQVSPSNERVRQNDRGQ